METCDCKTQSACTATSLYCGSGTTDIENAVSGLWLDFNTVLTGALTVVGYFLYKFSQALPALIRWPIRLFCSLTGLSSLWSWVSHLVGTLRIIQSLLKWLSRIWRFSTAVFFKLSQAPAVIKAITGSLTNIKQCVESANKPQKHIRRPPRDHLPDTDPQSTSSRSLPPSSREPEGLRLILLGPPGGGRTSLADALLGCRLNLPEGLAQPWIESSRRKAVVEGRKVTVVDTPDLLGPSMEDSRKAHEALRSLQLTRPGPHAIMLVIKAPGSGDGIDQDMAEATRVTLKLFGERVSGHVIPVLTHADCLWPGCSLAQLLEADAGSLRTALSLCGQRAELVDNRPDCPLVDQRAASRRLLERVLEMRALRGHFTHELQRREDHIREELLADMAAELAQKLGNMEIKRKR